MATTQHSEYYYNNASYHHYHHHHQSQQQQNYYGASSGQYDDCKNLNNHTANDAYSNYNYNLPNNYNNQWNHQHYNTIPNSTAPTHHQHQQHHQQSHYLHHQHQQQQQQQQQHNLNMLNNQINDDYKNYSNNNITSKSSPDTIQQHHQQQPTNVRNGEQPNLNCNQYIDRKDELFYAADIGAVSTVAAVTAASPSTVNLIATNKINEAISYPTSQLSTIESKKRKIDNQTDEENDSPALRALLSNPSKKTKHYNSPYFYQSHGNLSPISSTDNYPQHHYQLSSKPEEIISLINYKTKDGFEQNIDESQLKKRLPMDGKYSAVSLLTPSSSSPAVANSPMSSFLDNCIATPPTSPKDTKHDDSSDNLTTWNDHQNGGKFIKQHINLYHYDI